MAGPIGAFDEHLASLYDETRALSPEAMAALVALLRKELSARNRCLEIGIGTGRVALPLAGAGVDVVGIDLSMPMLVRLRSKVHGSDPFPIARADAMRLPFADREFDAVLACHVLHLIPDWEAAVVEAMRVVTRAGVLLVELSRDRRDGSWGELRQVFLEAAGAPRIERRGLSDASALDGWMERIGATGRELPPIDETRVQTLERAIARLEAGANSDTSQIPQDIRRQAAEHVRSWAREHLGDVNAPISRQRTIRWKAYDLPW